MYRKFVKIAVQSKMQYRADFLTGLVSVILYNAITFGSIGIMVQRFNNLNGWSLWEMVFLYNFFLLGHGINSIFFWHIRDTGHYVLEGTFDQFLIRPVSPLLQLLGREFHYLGIADLLFAGTGVTLAYHHLQLDWGISHWVYFFVAILSGTLVEVSLSLIIASLAFWVGRLQSLYQIFWQFNLMVQRYPVDILGSWFRLVVTFLIPVAFINYYPSLVLLGKRSLGGSIELGWASPAVAVILLLLASVVWRLAVRKYTSSGS